MARHLAARSSFTPPGPPPLGSVAPRWRVSVAGSLSAFARCPANPAIRRAVSHVNVLALGWQIANKLSERARLFPSAARQAVPATARADAPDDHVLPAANVRSVSVGAA